MKLSELPWLTLGKVAVAALGAAGLVGTGYLSAPAPAVSSDCKEVKLTIPLKVYVNGKEVQRK